MISALVRVREGTSVDALAATLGALVSAVAAGLVADAVVLAEQGDDGSERIADAVGAGFLVVEADEAWRRGAWLAKRDWVLLLEAGDVPGIGWIKAVERFVAVSPPERRFGRLPRAGGFTVRIAAFWRVLTGSARIGAGDVVRRDLLREGARPGRPARIAAAIGRDPVLG